MRRLRGGVARRIGVALVHLSRASSLAIGIVAGARAGIAVAAGGEGGLA